MLNLRMNQIVNFSAGTTPLLGKGGVGGGSFKLIFPYSDTRRFVPVRPGEKAIPFIKIFFLHKSALKIIKAKKKSGKISGVGCRKGPDSFSCGFRLEPVPVPDQVRNEGSGAGMTDPGPE